MALPGELLGIDGATCIVCGRKLELQVCLSNAGYYLGYECDTDGPISRESMYFRSYEQAQDALRSPVLFLRDTQYHGR
jgi:hypothetical protein